MKYDKVHCAENIKAAVIMRGTGHTHQEIADEIGVSRSTVANHLKQLKNEAEEHGVDETLQRILSISGWPRAPRGGILNERERSLEMSKSTAAAAINGIIANRIMDDLEWWMNHHRISSHWLIIRLWQLCYPGDEDIETLKTVVKTALPKYAADTGIDLAKWALEQNRCVNCGSTLAPSRQRSEDCCRIVVMK